jgi:hypothetical protein
MKVRLDTFLSRRANEAGGKQRDMDKRSAAESREAGRWSRDLEVLQKAFDK